MRLENIKFILPTGYWPGRSKASGGGFPPVNLWTCFMLLHFLSTRWNGYSAITWLPSSFLNWA